MTDDVLLAQRDRGVATLTLNRPRARNALTPELVERLGAELRAVGSDGTVRAIVLTGAGGAFCAGADLKAAMDDGAAMLAEAGQHLDRYQAIIRAVVRAPQPVIASVDGPAVGFGCDLALACDLRVLSTRAFLQEKFVRIGLVPDGGGTFSLARLVGLGRALELLLTGDRIDADRAHTLGLANRIVSPAELENETRSLARRLAAGPPMALAAVKRAVRDGLGGTIDDALAREKEAQLGCLHSADFLEGVSAWMEQRDPDFQGK